MSPWPSCVKTLYGPVGFRRGRRTQAFSFQVSSSMLQYEYKQTKVVGFLSYTYTPHAEKIERNVPGTSLFSDLCLATAVLKNPYLHSYRSVVLVLVLVFKTLRATAAPEVGATKGRN